MMEATRLIDVIGRLKTFNENLTIYAAEPWRAESNAIVEFEPETGRLPEEASAAGLKYFLEIAVALDFLEGWESSLARDFSVGWESTPASTPTDQERCDRLIRYALNDA